MKKVHLSVLVCSILVGALVGVADFNIHRNVMLASGIAIISVIVSYVLVVAVERARSVAGRHNRPRQIG